MVTNKETPLEYVSASIPEAVRNLIQERANERGIPFHLMAGRFIMLGVESELVGCCKKS